MARTMEDNVTREDARLYPVCHRHKLLRRSKQRGRTGHVIVSTSALYKLLKHRRHQECCKRFVYESNSGPRPHEIEDYLKKNLRTRKPAS